MKKSALTVAAVGLTGLVFFAPVFAAPTGQVTYDSEYAILQVSNMGVVANKNFGETAPQGLKAYPGTGRPEDIAAVSCESNNANRQACANALWVAIAADRIGQGRDATHSITDLTSGAIKCSYIEENLGISCRIPLRGFFNSESDLCIWLGGRLPGSSQTIAGYVPAQGGQGFSVTKDGEGHPHICLQIPGKK